MGTTAIKTDHLLDGSLEWLHQQTTEWLREVEFWREEIMFFHHLLQKKELQLHAPVQRVAELEKELYRNSNEELKELENRLLEHEGKLRVIIEAGPGSNESPYRHDHTIIQFLVQQFVLKIRDLKKSVFVLVKE